MVGGVSFQMRPSIIVHERVIVSADLKSFSCFGSCQEMVKYPGASSRSEVILNMQSKD